MFAEKHVDDFMRLSQGGEIIITETVNGFSTIEWLATLSTNRNGPLTLRSKTQIHH
jgi:hypothetical protein